ncbi:MAG TPA: hypothetical protein VMH87_00970 [Pseudomonadales bacterium]|nr:hypothetical protein [Pseudomonadales bacterium]
MPLRHIVGYFYLTFAAVLLLSDVAWFLWPLGHPVFFWTIYTYQNITLILVSAVAGILLRRCTGRLSLWLAVFVAVLGLCKFYAWRILYWNRFLPRTRMDFSGPFYQVLTDFASHILLLVMLVFSVVLLFRTENITASAPGAESTPVIRRSSVFGQWSVVIPIVGIPLVWIAALSTSGGGDNYGLLAAVAFIGWLALLGGFICVVVAFTRWEKRLILPLLGYVLNNAPFLYLAFYLSVAKLVMLLIGTLFCAACVIASAKTKEYGRNWSLLAAIPAGFAVLTLVQPVFNFLLAR